MSTTHSTGTVAVILTRDGRDEHWVETLSDEKEIRILEAAIAHGEEYPLELVYRLRKVQKEQEDEFGDYVEQLLSGQRVRSEVQNHGVAWLKSRIRMEKFKRQEQEAAEVIAQYALAKYKNQKDLTDFTLEGQGVEVRIKIFQVKLDFFEKSDVA